MPPTKSLDLLLDQFIETDINAMIEQENADKGTTVEPEQVEIDWREESY